MNQMFLDEFFFSLSKQSYRAFDLVVLNDGFGSLDKYRITYPELSIVELKFSGTPSQNRQHGLNFIKQASYQKVIFGDSDDTFSDSRVELSVELLDKVDIVVNDVNLFNKNGVYSAAYMSNRIKNTSLITLDDIMGKNLLGLSNTAVNTRIFNQLQLNFDISLIAVDWYFFSLLLQQGCSAIFATNFRTNYRQHDINTVGLGCFSYPQIKKLLSVKLKHYQLLRDINPLYEELLAKTEKSLSLIRNEEYVSNLVAHNNQVLKFPLWWECDFKENI
jgi:hypothetical protein